MTSHLAAPTALTCLLCVSILSGCSAKLEQPIPGPPAPDMTDARPDVSLKDTPEDLEDQRGEDTSKDVPNDTPTDVPVDTPPDESLARVPLLMAQGRMGSTVLSCDGGKGWFGARDMAAEGDWGYCDMPQPDATCDAGSCWTWDRVEQPDGTRASECVQTTPCKCRDHATGSATKVAWGGDQFIAAFGWGQPGTLFRSKDGVSVEAITPEGRPNPQGAAWGGGTWILGTDRVHRSLDNGDTWSFRERADRLNELGHPSDIHFIEGVGANGRFLLLGRLGAYISDDLGVTWDKVQEWPEWEYDFAGRTITTSCGNFGTKAASHGQTVVVTRTQPDSFCVSKDAGLSFERVPLPEFARGAGPAAWDGQRFHVIADRHHLSSPDGVTWTATDLDRAFWSMRAVYDHRTKTFAGVKGSYDDQRFFWSDDGVAWNEVPQGKAPRGHALKFFAKGWAPEGFVCPTLEVD